jgi:hypothetical protein
LLAKGENRNWAEVVSARRSNGQIATSDLLWFALQIAKAVSFLSENMVCIFIHSRLVKNGQTSIQLQIAAERRLKSKGLQSIIFICIVRHVALFFNHFVRYRTN